MNNDLSYKLKEVVRSFIRGAAFLVANLVLATLFSTIPVVGWLLYWSTVYSWLEDLFYDITERGHSDVLAALLGAVMLLSLILTLTVAYCCIKILADTLGSTYNTETFFRGRKYFDD